MIHGKSLIYQTGILGHKKHGHVSPVGMPYKHGPLQSRDGLSFLKFLKDKQDIPHSPFPIGQAGFHEGPLHRQRRITGQFMLNADHIEPLICKEPGQAGVGLVGLAVPVSIIPMVEDDHPVPGSSFSVR